MFIFKTTAFKSVLSAKLGWFVNDFDNLLSEIMLEFESFWAILFIDFNTEADIHKEYGSKMVYKTSQLGIQLHLAYS